jgi:hypothetical protein
MIPLDDDEVESDDGGDEEEHDGGDEEEHDGGDEEESDDESDVDSDAAQVMEIEGEEWTWRWTGRTTFRQDSIYFLLSADKQDWEECRKVIDVYRHEPELLEQLINATTEPSFGMGYFGDTALHFACRELGQVNRICELILLGAGESLQKVSSRKLTPLHICLICQYQNVLQLLRVMDSLVDINWDSLTASPNKPLSLLDLALMSMNPAEVAAYIASRGGSIHQTSTYHLYSCVSWTLTDIQGKIKLLVSYGHFLQDLSHNQWFTLVLGILKNNQMDDSVRASWLTQTHRSVFDIDPETGETIFFFLHRVEFVMSIFLELCKHAPFQLLFYQNKKGETFLDRLQEIIDQTECLSHQEEYQERFQGIKALVMVGQKICMF